MSTYGRRRQLIPFDRLPGRDGAQLTEIPEAHRAVADSPQRTRLQATRLQVQQQLLPGRLRLAIPVADGHTLLASLSAYWRRRDARLWPAVLAWMGRRRLPDLLPYADQAPRAESVLRRVSAQQLVWLRAIRGRRRSLRFARNLEFHAGRIKKRVVRSTARAGTPRRPTTIG